jgi:hypothetical protein
MCKSAPESPPPHTPSRHTPPGHIQLTARGKVYHIKHADNTHANPIWEAYQRAAIHTPRDQPLFQRRALKSKTVKGQLLSQQFAINSGASYKYIVETLSYTFEEGPGCVRDALAV